MEWKIKLSEEQLDLLRMGNVKMNADGSIEYNFPFTVIKNDDIFKLKLNNYMGLEKINRSEIEDGSYEGIGIYPNINTKFIPKPEKETDTIELYCYVISKEDDQEYMMLFRQQFEISNGPKNVNDIFNNFHENFNYFSRNIGRYEIGMKPIREDNRFLQMYKIV